jgi:hypothetical protein
MTIREALKQRIPRVRQPAWNSDAYLRLPLFKNGTHGPWAGLYDPAGQLAIKVPIGSQKLLTLDMLDDAGYEKYEGVPNPAESSNYAATYLES